MQIESPGPVLLIDPDPGARSLLQSGFERAGWSVVAVSNPDEAHRHLLPERPLPSVLISEVMLGPVDGFALCGRLRAEHRTSRLPVVLLSRERTMAQVELARAVGADDFVQKPAFVSDVVALVRLKGELKGAASLHSNTDQGPLLELLRALLAGVHSGRFEWRDGHGDFEFRNGKVTEAHFEGISGELGLSRMLVLGEGGYLLQLGSSFGRGTMELGARELSAGLFSKVRRWRALRACAVPIEARLTVDFRRLADALAELPEDVQRLVRLFDGRRTLRAVVMDAACAETTALEAATRLYALGVLTPAELEDGVMSARLVEARPTLRSPGVEPAAASQETAVSIAAPTVPTVPVPEPVKNSPQDSEPTAELPAPVASVESAPTDPRTQAVAATVEWKPEAVSAGGPAEIPGQPSTASDEAPVSIEPSTYAAPTEDTEVSGDPSPTRPIRLTDVVSPPTPALSPDTAFFSDEPEDAAAFRPRIRLPFPPRYVLAGVLLLVGVAIVVARVGGGDAAVAPPIPAVVVPPKPAIAMPDLPEPKTIPSEEALKLLTQGMKLYEAGKMKEAVQTLEKAVEAVPDSDTAWVMLGLARFDSQDTRGAQEAAQRALELSPKNGRALMLLASVYIALGERPKAQEQLKTYLSAEPKGQFAEEATRLLSVQ